MVRDDIMMSRFHCDPREDQAQLNIVGYDGSGHKVSQATESRNSQFAPRDFAA